MAVRMTHNPSMSPATLQGETLGKYRILEPLGRGGMAQVYKAYHPALDRYVAVKVLRSDLVEEAEFLSRFRREARAVASLRHPNIVQVFDFDVQDDLYYMVMELLEGDTLKAHLNALRIRGQKLSAGDLLRILTDVLAGLAYAHSEGVIHRDLKPANILLTARDQAVLTDFGIAQIVGATQYTVSGALMGTLSYMAPEQGLEGKCDARSDIYSLGIVFYEMLTGRVPFDADTPLAILMKHVNDPLPLPHQINPEISEAFERMVLKSLAKEPAERYQTATEMTQALQAAGRMAGVQMSERMTLLQPLAPAAQARDFVAVFSGPDRARLADPTFAEQDTAVRIDGSHPQQVPAGSARLGRTTLLWVVALVIGNMIMLWASGVFGWRVFAHAWPVELVLGGVLFFCLMFASLSPWYLIPGGLMVGNGLLLTYCTLTGRWSDWTYFWPLEPLLVAASIVGPFLIRRRPESGRPLLRHLAVLVLTASGLAFAIALILAVIRIP